MDGDLKAPEERIDMVLDEGHEIKLTAKYFIDGKVLRANGKPINTEDNDKSHNGDAYQIHYTNYTPLIGGEMAFNAIQSAIEGAKASVDYICWGFQSSMYFKRKRGIGGSSAPLNEADMIGSVMERVAARGVKIRILSWFNSLAQAQEPNLPGHINALGEYYGDPIPYATEQQRNFDYKWHMQLYKGKMPNIELRTRAFSHAERSAIESYLKAQSSDKDNIAALQDFLEHHFPTHHQKMVIVDYEAPDSAVGFVMGHNSTSKYWSGHPYSATKGRPDSGWDGPTPYHDNSSMITGPLLYDMNHNFSQAWDKVGGKSPSLLKARAGITPKSIPVQSKSPFIQKGGAGTSYHAPGQICRTQAQYEVRNIELAYLQAVMQIGRFVYFENQYFRFPPLITTMKKVAEANKSWGSDKHLYVFVTTNTTAPVEETQEGSSTNTYRMLDALGRSDTMPARARDKKETEIKKQLDSDETDQAMIETQGGDAPDLDKRVEKDKATLKDAQSKPIKRQDLGILKAVVCTLICSDHSGINAAPNKQSQLAASKARLNSLKSQQQSLDARASENYRFAGAQPSSSDQEQMSSLHQQINAEQANYDRIDALPNPQTPLAKPASGDPYKSIWLPVYIHSKTTIIDDAVLIHGSANLNLRSMEVDSEMNIVVQDYGAAKAMRRELWNVHTNGKGTMDDDDAAKAFNKWEDLIQQNKAQERKLGAPVASIIGFYDTQKTWGTQD